MKNKYEIMILLESGNYLVATKGYDKELLIGIADKNGDWFQDLALVRNALDVDKYAFFNQTRPKYKKMEVLVCTHGWDDEYSQKFLIEEMEEEEEE